MCGRPFRPHTLFPVLCFLSSVSGQGQSYLVLNDRRHQIRTDAPWDANADLCPQFCHEKFRCSSAAETAARCQVIWALCLPPKLPWPPLQPDGRIDRLIVWLKWPTWDFNFHLCAGAIDCFELESDAMCKRGALMYFNGAFRHMSSVPKCSLGGPARVEWIRR